MPSILSISRRQYDSYDDGYWYYSTTGFIVKWVIAAIILGIALLFVIAYVHATHRLKRGLPPLKYHAWIVRRRMQRAQAYNLNGYQTGPTQNFSFYNNNQQPPNPYGQQNFPPPPPVYNPYNNAGGPPAYYPPEAGESALNTAKVDYSQAALLPNVHGEGGSGGARH